MTGQGSRLLHGILVGPLVGPLIEHDARGCRLQLVERVGPGYLDLLPTLVLLLLSLLKRVLSRNLSCLPLWPTYRQSWLGRCELVQRGLLPASGAIRESLIAIGLVGSHIGSSDGR